MPEKKLFPTPEEIQNLFQRYDSNPDFFENNLRLEIETRIKLAKEQFEENFAKLSPKKVYSQIDLEVHFNFRMEEGLDKKLEELEKAGVLKKKVNPKTNNVEYKLKIPKLAKDTTKEQQTAEPSLNEQEHVPKVPLNFPKTISLEKFRERQRDLYLFLLQNNHPGESLHVDNINFPPNSRYGFGRKVAFLEMLCKLKPPLARDDGRFNYTLLKDE